MTLTLSSLTHIYRLAAKPALGDVSGELIPTRYSGLLSRYRNM